MTTATSTTGHYQDGFGRGEFWARRYATAAEWDRLQRTRQALGHEWESWFVTSAATAFLCSPGPAADLFFRIRPHLRGACGPAREFWESLVGDDHETIAWNPTYVRGFAEGALASPRPLIAV